MEIEDLIKYLYKEPLLLISYVFVVSILPAIVKYHHKTKWFVGLCILFSIAFFIAVVASIIEVKFDNNSVSGQVRLEYGNIEEHIKTKLEESTYDDIRSSYQDFLNVIKKNKIKKSNIIEYRDLTLVSENAGKLNAHKLDLNDPYRDKASALKAISDAVDEYKKSLTTTQIIKVLDLAEAHFRFKGVGNETKGIGSFSGKYNGKSDFDGEMTIYVGTSERQVMFNYLITKFSLSKKRETLDIELTQLTPKYFDFPLVMVKSSNKDRILYTGNLLGEVVYADEKNLIIKELLTGFNVTKFSFEIIRQS